MSLFSPEFPLSPYTYAGDRLREIAFPLGGIGAGCVSLDGRGLLRDWEIFNRPNKGSLLETTFAALWLRKGGTEPRALAVRGPRVRDWMGEGAGTYSYGHGQFFKQMDGLPGFDAIEFAGSFPFARVKFEKLGLPLSVQLCAFNPFVPLDVRSSSFPLACLVYRLENNSDSDVDFSLVWTMMNPVGEGAPDLSGELDRALNQAVSAESCTGIRFSNARFAEDDPRSGTACLCTSWPAITILPSWSTGTWFDGVQSFWNRFRQSGRVEGDVTAEAGPRVSGSLGAVGNLAPGESAELPFTVSWTFPNATKYWGGTDEPKGKPWKPFYAREWPNALDSAAEFHSRYEELATRTLKFEHALFTSTLPAEIIESVSATASILHSPTLLRLEDGTFWAWEGCSLDEGCCSGTCSHVWNYALTHAFLFPEIQESMRRTEYRYSFNCGPQGKQGALNFRVMIPLGTETKLWNAASDGQLGGVIQLYRDWRLTGSEALLRDLWPPAKRALEYAWVDWDRDRDGLVDGDMHNTYDINFQGPNPLTQFFYLGALRAGEEISRSLGDGGTADTYRKLYEAGREKSKKQLWNGSYFWQPGNWGQEQEPKYQHGAGCLTDQIFGLLCAKFAGLGDLIELDLVQNALEAIYRYNFRKPLGDHENLQRVYAVADEPGLLLCTWPNGGRPEFPFVYSDEVWTGIEYQFASHLALEGMTAESLDIVRGVRRRYDGSRRNPYNEFECGSHYARALASYGLLLSWSGFEYDAVNRTASLTPKADSDGRFFFSTPHGWGVATRKDGQDSFDLAEGALFP